MKRKLKRRIARPNRSPAPLTDAAAALAFSPQLKLLVQPNMRARSAIGCDAKCARREVKTSMRQRTAAYQRPRTEALLPFLQAFPSRAAEVIDDRLG